MSTQLSFALTFFSFFRYSSDMQLRRKRKTFQRSPFTLLPANANIFISTRTLSQISRNYAPTYCMTAHQFEPSNLRSLHIKRIEDAFDNFSRSTRFARRQSLPIQVSCNQIKPIELSRIIYEFFCLLLGKRSAYSCSPLTRFPIIISMAAQMHTRLEPADCADQTRLRERTVKLVWLKHKFENGNAVEVRCVYLTFSIYVLFRPCSSSVCVCVCTQLCFSTERIIRKTHIYTSTAVTANEKSGWRWWWMIDFDAM